MTIKVIVDGLYETDIGSGQKKLHDYEFTFELPRFKTTGLETLLMRRFIPMAIAENKKMETCSRVKTIHISDVQKMNNECSLQGKNILAMSEKEIQELACLFDLYEIPLPRKMSLSELRERAFEIYSERVLGIPLKEDKDKAKYDIYEKTSAGYKLLLEEQPVDISNLKVENVVEKKPEKQNFSALVKSKQNSLVNEETIEPANESVNESSLENNNENKGGLNIPSLANLLNVNNK